MAKNKGSFKKGHTINKGRVMSQKQKDKISKTLTGTHHKMSKEGKENIRKAHIELWKDKEHPMLGKHHTEKTKEKISKANKGKHFSPDTEFKKGDKPLHSWKKGEKSPNWNGFKKDRIPWSKNPEIKCKHHIWYEDNKGKSTDNGVMLVTHAHHMEIHAVLWHNLWTDNRRCLTG